ncbi:unnamed protein product [Phytophthora lilii]|uniref:Unnamed protein product n=1 Tax=Phytophthora lilii TaxID=2077276 RepID=A0A9W6YJD6_9STRA|nr:unnamed protein product [Phytophthora lilii]
MAGTPKPAGDSRGAPHAGAEHLDSFASAAGLMQLSSAAMAADAADAGNSSSNNSSGAAPSPADASLPPGWQRIIHGSGLPCYVHDGLGVVCWTRPYPLDVGSDGELSQPEFHRLVKQHVPPLSIFAPGSDAAARKRKESVGAAEASGAAASPSLPALTSQEPSSVRKGVRCCRTGRQLLVGFSPGGVAEHCVFMWEQAQSKKRKLDTALKERPHEKGSANSKQQSMVRFLSLSRKL